MGDVLLVGDLCLVGDVNSFVAMSDEGDVNSFVTFVEGAVSKFRV